MMMVRGGDRDFVPNSSIKEAERFGETKGMRLLDGENWLPRARRDLLDGMEDDAIWVDRDTARLSHLCK